MSDTPYKQTSIPVEYLEADGEAVSWPAELRSGGWSRACRTADTVLNGRRVLVDQHTGGSSSWLVGNDATGDSSPTYPDPETWRTVCQARLDLTPGNALELRVIAAAAGASEYYKASTATYEYFGAGGSLRVVVGWDNVAADSATTTAEVDFEGSEEDEGVEDTDDGASWATLQHHFVLFMRPDDAQDSPVEAEKWSEETTVTITIQHRAGARVVHASVAEVPIEHVAKDDDLDVTAHGYAESLEHPDDVPLEESPNGATYEEHRHGTHRMLDVGARQVSRLGAVIARWGAYAEGLAAVDDDEIAPIQVTSSSLVGLSIGSGFTAWDADNPGHDCFAHGREPEHLETRIDGAAAVQVRCRVLARFTAAGSSVGTIRWQSTARSWVELEVDQAVVGTTWTWVTATGWLETTVAGDDPEPVLQDFASVTGGALEVRAWAVTTGDFAVG